MADVWGRLTGRTGVCLATLGPGATNLMTAWPTPTSTGRRWWRSPASWPAPPPRSATSTSTSSTCSAVHEVDHQIASGDDIPSRARGVPRRRGGEARRLPHGAAGGRGGGGRPGRAPPRLPAAPPVARPAVPRRARPDIVNRADRPLILAGNGVIRGHAARELRALAERAQIPVVTTFMAKGALPADHPLMVTTVGLDHRGHRARRVREGGRRRGRGLRPGGVRPGPLEPRRGTRGSSTSTSRPPRWTRATSRTSRSSPTCARRWSCWRRWWRAPPREPPALPRPILAGARTPSRCSRSAPWPTSRRRWRRSLVISDVGAHKLWVAKAYGARLPNTVIISNGFAAMGIGLPGGDRRQARPCRTGGW